MEYFFGSDASGVQRLFLPQDTTEAARQAVTPQAPGSEFRPVAHPDIPRLLAEVNRLEVLCSSYCDELYMKQPHPTWQRREELHDLMQAADRDRAGIQNVLKDLYEATSADSESPEPDMTQPAPAPATVISNP